LLDWAENQPHQIRVLGYAPNRGKGYAVRHGLAAARGNIRIFTDVDLSYGFDDVLRIANTLRDGADLAIASRTHAESRLVLPAHLQGYVYRRHLQTMVYSLLVRLFLRLPIRDTQAGLKGVTARAANLILRYLHCDGFAFDCELLSAAFRLGLTITEVPVCVHHHDASSTTGFSSLAEMMIDVWRIRRTWRRRLPLVQGPVEGDLRKAA
jgi:dolichyl-phosphate beta-glucosyltransferase